MRRISLLLSCMWVYFGALCQVSIDDNTTVVLIDFDNTVSGINIGSYNGSGLNPTPTNGNLDANAWQITGMSEGDHQFGDTNLSGDYARGTLSSNANSGGLYAFTTATNNQALGIQPTNDDLTPGTITLRVVNNRTTRIDELNINYDVRYRNDQDRSNSLNFSFSWNNNSYISKSAANFSTPEIQSPNPSWQTVNRSAELYSISLDPGEDIFLRWSSDLASGSGFYDEIGIDNISITTEDPYYDGVVGLTCKELKTALHFLIKDHTVLSYGGLWNIYDTTDPRLNDNGNQTILWDLYTDNPSGSETELLFGTNQCSSSSNGGQEGFCYNREHTFPKSWWGGTLEDPEYTDAHCVLPVDAFMNTRRSNFPYSIVEPGTETYIANNGSKIGLSAIPIPGYTGRVFEPIDEYKGDLARVYFYLATRYQDVIGPWQYAKETGDAVLDGSTFKVFECWKVELLLDWHRNDPVSQKEIDRNNAVATVQNNRNPFVDHPDFVELIWDNPACIVEPPVERLHTALFESGYDGWASGGSDCIRYNGFYSYENDYSMQIRDNSGIYSSMTSPAFDITAYTEVELSFFYQAVSMDFGEKFIVLYNDGSGWNQIHELVSGTDFFNDEIYETVIQLPDSVYTLSDSAQFRIQCDASDNFDRVHIDEIILVGKVIPKESITPTISLWLEGVYDNGSMSSSLMQKNLLPLEHPYAAPPWNVAALEGLCIDASDIPQNTIDWVTVSFRTDPSSATEVAATVGLLLNDGTVHFPRTKVGLPTIANAYYVVVEHRNHMGAMSAAPVPVIGGEVVHDFRSGNSYTGVGAGQKQLSTGEWGLYVGDGDQLADPIGYDINAVDNTQWKQHNGLFNVYSLSDYNFDGDVNANDKVLWNSNNGVFSAIGK